MAVGLKCKTCGKILPTANKDEEQVTVCTDCANVLFAATDAAFASNRPERRQDVKVPRLQPGMENPYQPYAAPQGMMDREVHSATYPVQNTVPTFGKIFNHAVAAWKANLWLMVAAWFITFW